MTTLKVFGLILISSLLTLLWATVIIPVLYYAITNKRFSRLVIDLDNHIEDKYIYKTKD